jgi:integrase/recombinase XerD
MTPLRKRMVEDMQLRNLAPETQRGYLHHVTGLAQFYQTSPEHLNLEDIRQYQVYLANECRYSAESVNQFLSAVRFLYGITLEAPFDTGCLLRARVPKHAPLILSQQEVACFFDHVPSIRYRAALMVAYGAGLRVSEVAALKVADIDSQRMLLRVQKGKGQRDRYAMLPRACWKSCAPGGAPRVPPTGCFPAGVSMRISLRPPCSRPATMPPGRPVCANASPSTRSAIASPLTC